MIGVSSTILGLAWAYALWVAARRARRATELARIAEQGFHDGSHLPSWFSEPLLELDARDPEVRARAFGEMVTEVDYQLAVAGSASSTVRIALATTLAITVLTWWNDRAVAWALLAGGGCVTICCLALEQRARRATARARQAFAPLIRRWDKTVSKREPPSSEPRSGRNESSA